MHEGFFRPAECTQRMTTDLARWKAHDPTTLNRQGNDVGTQYRSAIFYHSDEQRRTAEQVMQEITAEKIWDDPLVTQLEPASQFYVAEGYHQDYYQRNSMQPYCLRCASESPKIPEQVRVEDATTRLIAIYFASNRPNHWI